MIVYNITIKVHPAVESEWALWQKREHSAEIMATGCFHDYKFYRLLEQDESDGITYIAQYFASSIDYYNAYINEFSVSFLQKAFDRWGDRIISFQTVMQLVN